MYKRKFEEERNLCYNKVKEGKGGIFMKELENQKSNVKKVEKKEKTNTFTKKHSKTIKILVFILLAILLIYVIIIMRRAIIMTSLSEKAKERQVATNYYVKQYNYLEDTFVITESYHLENDYLTIHTWYSDDKDMEKIISYRKGEEKISILETKGRKYILDANTVVGENILPVTYVSDGFLANLQYAILVEVAPANCKGKECYVIKGDGYERYVDKETGLAVREIEEDQIKDFTITFDVVKDTDIVKPDTTDAIMYVQNK